jgi:hypothetical protein
MSEFPSGDFTITNIDTERKIRVILADSDEYEDYQLGNTYTTVVTGKPHLMLEYYDEDEEEAPPELETLWCFNDSVDSYGKVRATLVSVAVKEKQNIGSYVIGITSHPARRVETTDPQLELMMPDFWTGSFKQWHEFALNIDDFILQAPVPKFWTEGESAWQVFVKMGFASPYSTPGLIESLEALPVPHELKSGTPIMELLGSAKNYYEYYRLSDARKGTPQGGTTELTGDGTDSSYSGMNKRWQTDGTYIWSVGGGDGSGGPIESESYLTDLDRDDYNSLVGLPKGEYGQRWIFKPV